MSEPMRILSLFQAVDQGLDHRGSSFRASSARISGMESPQFGSVNISLSRLASGQPRTSSSIAIQLAGALSRDRYDWICSKRGSISHGMKSGNPCPSQSAKLHRLPEPAAPIWRGGSRDSVPSWWTENMHALVRRKRLDQVGCPREKLTGGVQLCICPTGEVHGVWVKHAVEV